MADHYTYRLSWSAEDQEHVATCAEFPGLSWLEEDEIEALRGIMKLVREVVEDLRANGEPVPEPLADKEFAELHGPYPAGAASRDRHPRGGGWRVAEPLREFQAVGSRLMA